MCPLKGKHPNTGTFTCAPAQPYFSDPLERFFVCANFPFFFEERFFFFENF
jgi:hypothetical protein